MASNDSYSNIQDLKEFFEEKFKHQDAMLGRLQQDVGEMRKIQEQHLKLAIQQAENRKSIEMLEARMDKAEERSDKHLWGLIVAFVTLVGEGLLQLFFARGH